MGLIGEVELLLLGKGRLTLEVRLWPYELTMVFMWLSLADRRLWNSRPRFHGVLFARRTTPLQWAAPWFSAT